MRPPRYLEFAYQRPEGDPDQEGLLMLMAAGLAVTEDRRWRMKRAMMAGASGPQALGLLMRSELEDAARRAAETGEGLRA